MSIVFIRQVLYTPSPSSLLYILEITINSICVISSTPQQSYTSTTQPPTARPHNTLTTSLYRSPWDQLSAKTSWAHTLLSIECAGKTADWKNAEKRVLLYFYLQLKVKIRVNSDTVGGNTAIIQQCCDNDSEYYWQRHNIYKTTGHVG